MVATWPSLCRETPVQQNGYNMALDYNAKECLRSKMVATCPSTLYRNESPKELSVEIVDKGGIYHSLYLHFQQVCHLL
jgi:hypothetical protein